MKQEGIDLWVGIGILLLIGVAFAVAICSIATDDKAPAQSAKVEELCRG